MRNHILLCLFAAPGLFAQSVTLSVGSGSGPAGSAVSVPVTLTNSGGALPAGLQWTFNPSSGITGVTVVAGTAASNAQKSVQCAGNSCVVIGGQNAIANGVVATATFQLSGSASGTISINLTGVAATSASATSIPASGVSGSIVVSAPGGAASLSSIGCAPSSIPTPGTSFCSANLTAAAPSGGFQVLLSSNNGNLSVPPSITIGAGQTSGSFSATAAAVATNQSNVTITASAGGVTKTASFILLASAQVQSLSCTPGTIGSSSTSTCTVTLNTAATSPLVVSLSSDNGLLTVPPSVTVATTHTTATFPATTGVIAQNQSAIISASLNGGTQPFTVNLTTSAQLIGVSCSPSSFGAPGTSTCTVTLSGAAPANTSPTISSDNTKVTVPANVAFTTGQSAATFTATVAAPSSNQTATLTVTLNSISRTTTLSLTVPSLVTLFCTPSTLSGNQSATCTVMLDKNAGSPTLVGLSSSTAALQVPASVTVAAGSSSATFSAATAVLTSSDQAVVTATLNGQNRTANLTLAASFKMSSLICTPSFLTTNGSTNCTLGFTQPATSAAAISLSSSLLALTTPSTVTLPVGQSSVAFTAMAGTISTPAVANVSAVLNGQTLSTQVTLNTPGQLIGISCSRGYVVSGGGTTCVVSLVSSAVNAVDVAIAVNSPAVIAPASVTVNAGAATANFQIVASTVTEGVMAMLSAKLSANTVTTSIRVKPDGATLLGLISQTNHQPGQFCSPRAAATLSGSGFTSQSPQVTAEQSWPTQLAGVQVKINNQPAPLLAVSDSFIHFQCPALPSGTQLTIVVEPESGRSPDPLSTVMHEAAPGILELDVTSHQGDVLITGTDLVASTAVADKPGRPAKKGEYLSIYADGLGPVNEGLPPGIPAPLDRLISATAPVTVVIGESELALSPSFAGLAPGSVGLFVINVRLPDDVETGASVPLYLKVVLSDGTVVSTNIVKIAVANPDIP